MKTLEQLIINRIFGADEKPIEVKKALVHKGEEGRSLDELREDTLSHIQDVRQGLAFLASELMMRAEKHDHTKLDSLPNFKHDMERNFEGDDLTGWWELHLTERHHLNDSVPDDVNLVDVMEFLVDCCVAGAARSGSVRPITIKPDVLMLAFKNTRKLLCNNIRIVGEVGDGNFADD